MTRSIIGRCWHCGAELTVSDYGRETACLACGKPTRVCRNCCWYDPARTNQCKEPQAERVMAKERANYCEFFAATAELESEENTPRQDLRQAAEDLFK